MIHSWAQRAEWVASGKRQAPSTDWVMTTIDDDDHHNPELTEFFNVCQQSSLIQHGSRAKALDVVWLCESSQLKIYRTESIQKFEGIEWIRFETLIVLIGNETIDTFVIIPIDNNLKSRFERK